MVSLCPFLAGCGPGGKSTSDAVQYMLRQDLGTRWVFCLLLVIAIWQFFKLLRAGFRLLWWTLKQSKMVLFRPRLIQMAIAALLATILWATSEPLADLIQEWEQYYVSPVWVGKYGDRNEAYQTAIYEAELAKRVNPYELEVIKRRTREMAPKIQSTPLAIYECAYLECGLNPFTIRKDLVAAGWIQFTKVGLLGLRYEDKSISYDQVLYACRNRNIDLMMDLTEIYLTDKYRRAKEIPLHNTIDLYLALFAPAYIGASSDKILYQGYSNPSYYLNKGLDGWYTTQDANGQQLILRKNANCDGAITIYEIFLALEAKKARLLDGY
jgi:hypothetical protein